MNVKEKDKFYWDRTYRKEIPSVSSMVLIKNKNGVVIATDSRLTKGNKYRDDFRKVFIIPEKDIMYGVVGFYGSDDENILKEIHQSLKTMTLEKAVEKITKIAKGFALYQQTNIYIVHKGQVTIIDLIRDNVFCGNVPENHVGVISIGSHSFSEPLHLSLSIAQPIDGASLA